MELIESHVSTPNLPPWANGGDTLLTSPALKQLKKLQQALYDKAYAEAHAVVVGTSRNILVYSDQFEASLPQRFQMSTLTSLIEAMRKKQFLLFGDFHTLRQSQRGLLRLLRSYTERLRTSKVVLALEMIKSRDQDELEAYMEGVLPEREFLERINYVSDWGFPWQNFRMFLEFAREKNLPVIGINSDNAGRDSLVVRDKFAAEELVDVSEEYPDHLIVCLIGEYHLADGYLPTALSREIKRRGCRARIMRVLNNVDRYYFQMEREPSRGATEYLRLKKDFYCIMNSPPWMKWQSFSMWEEMRNAGVPYSPHHVEIHRPADPHTEDVFDIDYQFFNFTKDLVSFLNLQFDDRELEGFHVFSSQDVGFLEDILYHEHLDSVETKAVIERALEDGVYLLCQSHTILLTQVSMNNLAEAAGQYVYTLGTRFDDRTGTEEDRFYRRTMKAAVGMVASKIFNPRRKCSSLADHRRLVRRFKHRRLVGGDRVKRDLAKSVLRHDEWVRDRLLGDHEKMPRIPQSLILADTSLNGRVSREIGLLLGDNLYRMVVGNKVSPRKLTALFNEEISTPHDLWREFSRLYSLMAR